MSRNHYPDGHNVGLGMVRDTPEEKEIARLQARVTLLEKALREMTGNFRMSLLLVSSHEGRAEGMSLVRDAEKILGKQSLYVNDSSKEK